MDHRRTRLATLIVVCLLSGTSCVEGEGPHPRAAERLSDLSGLCSMDGRSSEQVDSVRPNDWFVLAGSFVHTYDVDICQEWEALVEAGYSPRLAWSDALPSFRPGWIVIVEGPHRPDSAQALAAEIEGVVPGALAWPGW